MDDDSIAEIFVHPESLNEEHWDIIRALAREIMVRDKVDYLKASVLAYIEWFEMTEMDGARH